MNCPHVQNLVSAFIDCELDAEEKREFRQHMFICPECSVAYQELLEIRDCLQNIAVVPLNFDPLTDLHMRLSNDEHLLSRQIGKFFWIGRMGLVAACLSAFFLSTYFLFPANQGTSTRMALNNRTNTNTNARSVRFSTPSVNTVSTFDQDFSIDQPVTVYQASFVLP